MDYYIHICKYCGAQAEWRRRDSFSWAWFCPNWFKHSPDSPFHGYLLRDDVERVKVVRSDPVYHPVGEGPEYEAIRAEARKLLPLFEAGAPSTAEWGAGLIELLKPVEGGHQAAIIYPVVSAWKQERNAITRTVDLGMIRATGIALLAYAEAHNEVKP